MNAFRSRAFVVGATLMPGLAGAADAERAATVLSAVVKRLSNILIPIQSTVKGVYGHDPYGYTPQLTPIPCLYDTPRYAALPADGEQRHMLETHLRRQRNRVADAIADACATITHALGQVGE
jgi:hypothetical protein